MCGHTLIDDICTPVSAHYLCTLFVGTKVISIHAHKGRPWEWGWYALMHVKGGHMITVPISVYRRLTQRYSELVDRFIVMNCPHGRLVYVVLHLLFPCVQYYVWAVLVQSHTLHVIVVLQALHYVFILCRVFKQFLEKSWRQLSKSWVRCKSLWRIPVHCSELKLPFLFLHSLSLYTSPSGTSTSSSFKFLGCQKFYSVYRTTSSFKIFSQANIR